MQHMIVAAITSTLFVLPASAQVIPQGADPAFLQQALGAIQGQRNRALDEAAAAEAQLAQAHAQVTELKKQIDDLKAKYEPASKEQP